MTPALLLTGQPDPTLVLTKGILGHLPNGPVLYNFCTLRTACPPALFLFQGMENLYTAEGNLILLAKGTCCVPSASDEMHTAVDTLADHNMAEEQTGNFEWLHAV